MTEASNPTPPQARPPWAADVFVWGAWVLMLGGALWFTWSYGSPYPYFDDFSLVHEITGEFPVTGKWIWEQYNDHRIPLPRLIWVGLYRGFGGDFRAGMVLNVLCMGVVAAALIVAARKLRGHAIQADAFFPLLFLTWQGKLSLFLWSFILQLSLSTFLAGIVLAIIAANRQVSKMLPILVAGLCIAMLPLCGANGVVMTPALACWLAAVGIHGGMVQRRVGAAAAPLLLAALAFGVVGFYFVGFEKDMGETTRDPLSILHSGFMFVTMGFGMGSEFVYQAIRDGLHQFFVYVGPAGWAEKRWPYALLGGFAALLLLGFPLVRVWCGRSAERFRILGLSFFLAACGYLTLAIGFGRGGSDVFEQYRYIVLATPMFAVVYLIWTLCGGGVGRIIQYLFFVAFCVLLPLNMERALISARLDRETMARFATKVNDGTLLIPLVDEFAKHLVLQDDQSARERTAGYMLYMKKHGDRHYANLNDPPFPLGVRVDAGQPLPPGLFLESGWHGYADGRLWSGKEPVIKFWLTEAQKSRPMRLQIWGNTFEAQKVEVVLNGSTIARLEGDGGPPRMFEVLLPPIPDITKPGKPGELREYNILKLQLPQAHSKRQAGQGDDDRPLGLGIVWLAFD